MMSMRTFRLSASAVLGVAALLVVGLQAPRSAQEESKPVKSARSGALAKTTRHQFEVFFYTTGLRVFPLDSAGSPLDASKLTGTATFYHPNSPKLWLLRPLHAATVGPGQATASQSYDPYTQSMSEGAER